MLEYGNIFITNTNRMKTLMFVSGFAFVGFLSYGWVNSTHNNPVENQIYSASMRDTVPKSKDSLRYKNDTLGYKKDSLGFKKWGKDSLNRRDTSWPKRDSTKH